MAKPDGIHTDVYLPDNGELFARLSRQYQDGDKEETFLDIRVDNSGRMYISSDGGFPELISIQEFRVFAARVELLACLASAILNKKD